MSEIGNVLRSRYGRSLVRLLFGALYLARGTLGEEWKYVLSELLSSMEHLLERVGRCQNDGAYL